MADLRDTTLAVARPYATAAFNNAIAHGAVSHWSALLQQTTRVVQQDSMQQLLHDPRFSKELMGECLLAACQPFLFEAGTNFLMLLTTNRRLLILPAIECLFASYYALHANQTSVQAISSIPLSTAEAKALALALEKRLKNTIKLSYTVDPSLLGGLMLKIGDLVIDASVRGTLERLRATLVN